jgi:DNA-binding transcriptional LysR family regulator
MHVMEISWDDLRTVLAVVRGGTLAKASQALGVNYTTVARRVSRLEAALDTRLFDRLADGYHPTPAGLAVARRAEAMDTQSQDLLREVSSLQEDVAGPLVVTAPQLLIASHLHQVIGDFMQAYPQVDLTVRATNDLLDLNRREADLAIRIQRNPHETLVGKRLAAQQTAAFASAELVQRMRDGKAWGWLGFTNWTQPPQASLRRFPDARILLRFDDMIAVIAAAKAGIGVARMPLFVGRDNGLQQVDVMESQDYADIWALSHRDIARVPKVQAFRDMLDPFFRAHRQDFVDQARK